MTINKVSRTNITKKFNFFYRPVFIHGQLYITASRVRSFDSLRFYISEYNDQEHLANDEFLQNVPFTEKF